MGNAGQKLPADVFWHGFRCLIKRVSRGSFNDVSRKRYELMRLGPHHLHTPSLPNRNAHEKDNGE